MAWAPPKSKLELMPNKRQAGQAPVASPGAGGGPWSGYGTVARQAALEALRHGARLPEATGGIAAPAQATPEGQVFDSSGPVAPVHNPWPGVQAAAFARLSQGMKAHVAAGGHVGGPFAQPKAGGLPAQFRPHQVIDDSAQGLNRIATLVTHGPRTGQAALTYDLPNGLRAHVYYDVHGKQQVFLFKP